MLASSRDFGFTQGTTHAERIVLTSLGQQIASPTNKQEEIDAFSKAFFSIGLFKQVYEYYNGGELPEFKYLQGMLERTLGLATEYHQEFATVYTKNLEYIEKLGVKQGKSVPHTKHKKIDVTTPSETTASTDKTEFSVFVAMPFVEKTSSYPPGFFKEVLNSLIKPGGERAGFTVETASREGSDVIHYTIINMLLDADLVIVDLTEHNPNVLFELGLRMSAEKPVALIRAKGTLSIFDVDNLLRVFEYDPKLWKSTLEQDLPNLEKHIKASWEGRNKRSYMKILRGQAQN